MCLLCCVVVSSVAEDGVFPLILQGLGFSRHTLKRCYFVRRKESKDPNLKEWHMSNNIHALKLMCCVMISKCCPARFLSQKLVRAEAITFAITVPYFEEILEWLVVGWLYSYFWWVSEMCYTPLELNFGERIIWGKNPALFTGWHVKVFI